MVKTMKLFQLNELAHLLHCSLQSNPIIQGFSVDTRTLCPGNVYVALLGARVDGHAFIEEAKAKGAVAAIVANHYRGEQDIPLLRVENPLQALQKVAKTILASRSTRLAAITGSLGKTTTKDFATAFLKTQYTVASTPGNYNSQIGLPLAILNHLTGEEEIFVMEMGMTGFGQLAQLIQMAPPEVALVTTVSLVHACHFQDGLHDIVRAKSEIFLHPNTRFGILHHESPYFSELYQVGTCPKLSFSTTSPQADYFMNKSNQLHFSNHLIPITTLQVPGQHHRHNLLAAIALARYFNISWENINRMIPLLKLPANRLEWVQHQGILFLNDSYNAAELSIKAALEILPTPKGNGRKVAVLGSILELGRYSEEAHQRVGKYALNYVDQLFCLGEECQPIYQVWKEAGKPVELFDERKELVQSLRLHLKPSDVVLLKGSRSKELWKVLEEL